MDSKFEVLSLSLELLIEISDFLLHDVMVSSNLKSNTVEFIEKNVVSVVYEPKGQKMDPKLYFNI